ncbi:MAG: DNA translocase FtsK 4TM domain-containing protein [Candidatus Rokubacteria bacterium]|nr:DNA translocase FtsK 4TM domain-containing protein [Candidatus Rokubacteria bacterium]
MAGRIVDPSVEETTERSALAPDALRRRAARKAAREHGRWVREVKGILALALAGFSLVALYAFDPTRHALDQSSPVGPVGLWLGWTSFQAFGYAGYLFPLLLACYGGGAFIRSRIARGWPGLVGLVLLLISVTGLLARASDTITEVRIHKGGLLGWAVTEALLRSVGGVGTWIILLVTIPVGALFVTQASLGLASRGVGARLAGLWRRQQGTAAGAPLHPALSPGGGEGRSQGDRREEPEVAPRRLVVKEPPRPRSSLVEKGLAWQETFDFGTGGAQAFQLPAVGLLAAPPPSELKRTREELEANAATLKRKLQDFGVGGHIVQASPGPVITSYEFEPAPGIKVSQVVNLSDDLALAMKAAAVRIVGPIPGRGTVAVEVPNPEQATVYLREILISSEFVESKGKLPLALGKDTTGNPVVSDLTAMPHLLIAGSTGSGKSVGLNTMICSLLYKATPADVRFLLIDPKRLELGIYEGIPHLLAPVVTDSKEASMRLKWIVGKMDERYKLLQAKAVRNIEGYNREVAVDERIPYWVVVVDELADLMMVSAGEVQNSLVRLAQIARAVGIHLIIATQRPSVDVVTGLIKANFPTRIAFQVASKVDSRTVLDQNGAEGLLGRGDMIFVPPGAGRPMRVHGAWVADHEVKAICEFLRKQGAAVYEKVELPPAGEGGGVDAEARDDIYRDAVNLVIAQRQASISFLQRRLGLGYPKAARFIDMMEQDRIIGPGQGAKAREILVGPDYLAKRGR